MNNDIYAPERIDKIKQIMPNFARVAQPGDEVYMGLEGDPCQPANYRGTNRPVSVISNIVPGKSPGEFMISMHPKNDAKNVQTFSSSTINQHELWEFTDPSFEKVLAREQMKSNRAESSMAPHSNPASEMQRLRSELSAHQAEAKVFNNTIIQTMSELANDIVKLDKAGDAQFARTFRSEYSKLHRSEDSNLYRGADNDDAVQLFSDNYSSSSDDE
jgi:hypothetical protein